MCVKEIIESISSIIDRDGGLFGLSHRVFLEKVNSGLLNWLCVNEINDCHVA